MNGTHFQELKGIAVEEKERKIEIQVWSDFGSLTGLLKLLKAYGDKTKAVTNPTDITW